MVSVLQVEALGTRHAVGKNVPNTVANIFCSGGTISIISDKTCCHV